MFKLKKKYYLFIIFLFSILVYSSFINIGPWDEYHLLYYFKNKLYFPIYDSNFTYYDAYLLGRFSPITGQEFNIPLLFGLDINYSFLLVSIIIFFSIIIYFYIINYFDNFFDIKNYIFFIVLILSSPAFYLLTTRLLYAEDTFALLVVIFLFSFLKYTTSEKLNNKFFWSILLTISTFLTLLYKENSFVIIITFVLSYFFFDSKRKYKLLLSFIALLSLIYLLILIYINIVYKSSDLAYVQNINTNILINSLLTLVRYSIFNDPLLFFILIPVGLISLKKSKNIFFKSMFISGIMNILFFIFLGLYGPYYLYPCYFLIFPLFYEGARNLLKFNNSNKKLGINFIMCIIFLSFINSIFYFFESKSLSLTFNSTVNYLVQNIKKKEKLTKIFICNNLSDGNLAQVYILGEHIKYNDIKTDQFEFYPLRNNKRNILNSKISPFDKNYEDTYNNSIFQNTTKTSSPQKGDFILNIYSYSSNGENSCSFLKAGQYNKLASYTSSFYNTLFANLIKVLIYKRELKKDYFVKKFGYEIFEFK